MTEIIDEAIEMSKEQEKTEIESGRKMAKIFCVYRTSDVEIKVGAYENKKALQSFFEQYSNNGIYFDIISIIKGHEVEFTEKKVIEFK
jgi:hypothetical protein